MLTLTSDSRENKNGVKNSTFRTFRRDERGVTAIEFGIVALPFFMFAFGIMGTGLHFFTQNALEHSVETAARQIRTGQAQTGGATMGDFKALVAQEAGPMIDPSKLNILMQAADDWTQITPMDCTTGAGGAAPSTGSSGDGIGDHGGGAGQVVLVTACYQWDLAKAMPFLQFDKLADGTGMIQASTTFRTEPYE